MATTTRARKSAPKPPVSEVKDLEPTEAELKEAAALKDAVESPEVVAEARKADPRPPRAAPKTGRWFGVATDREQEVMVTEEPYGTPEAAREAAPMVLPEDRKPRWIVPVEAASRDEALARYEALKQVEKRSGEPLHAPKVEGTRVRLFETRTVPVEADTLYLTKTGILHADPECRFVKGRQDVVQVPNPEHDLVARVSAIAVGEKLALLDGTRTSRGECLFCAVTAAAPQAATA